MNRLIVSTMLTVFTYGCGGGIELTNKLNKPPVAHNDTIETLEDTPVAITELTANDTDEDADALSIVAYSTPSHGSLEKSEQGEVSYIPVENFFGEDQFEYTISDGRGSTHSAVVTVIVKGVNDAPVAIGDSATIPPGMYGQAIDIADLNVVEDIDSTQLSYEVLDAPFGEDFSLSADGFLNYVPPAGFEGINQLRFSVSDGEFSTDVTLKLTIVATNDAPQASDDEVISNRTDVIKTANLLDNDIDLDGDDLFVVDWSQPKIGGKVYYLGEGKFEFTPDEQLVSGSYSFDYTVSDGKGGEDQATVTLNIQTSWNKSIIHSELADWTNHVYDEHGNIMLLWTTQNKYNEVSLWARYYDNSEKKWLAPTSLENEGGTIINTPQVLIDENGYITVIWLHEYSNTEYALLANHFRSEKSWRQDPKSLATRANSSANKQIIRNPIASIDKHGNIGVAWLQQEMNGFFLSYMRYRASIEQWSGNNTQEFSTTVSDPNSVKFDIHAMNDIILVSWVDGPLKTSYFNLANAGQNAWEDRTLSSADVGLGIPVLHSIHVDKDRNVDFIWTQSLNGVNNVWSSHIDMSVGTLSSAIALNTNGNVLSQSISTESIKDENKTATDELHIAWVTTANSDGTGTKTIGFNAKKGNNAFYDPNDLQNVPNQEITIPQTEEPIDNYVQLVQTSNGCLAVWKAANPANPDSHFLWSSLLSFDQDDLFTATHTAKLDFSEGSISAIKITMNASLNPSILWTLVDSTSYSRIMSQHVIGGEKILNSATTVSTGIPDLIPVLGMPLNLQAATTPEGHIVASWEHLSAKTGKREIWTNTRITTGDTFIWQSAQPLLEDFSPDSRLQDLSINEDGRIYLSWSQFDGQHDQLFVSIRKDIGDTANSQSKDRWDTVANLDIGTQYDHTIVGVVFNDDELPSIIGTDKKPQTSTETLWSIDFR